MLDLMRQNSKSALTWVIFSVIILSFIFTFSAITPDQACGGAGPGNLGAEMGEVGDVEIDAAMLDMAEVLTPRPPSPRATDPRSLQQAFLYKNTRFGNLGLGGPYMLFGVDAQRTSPILTEKAMNDLVETILVSEEARRMGLRVSDNELAERLFNDTWFDEQTGAFKRREWERQVRATYGVSAPRFEEFIRRELLREKMIALLVEGMVVPDDELALYHKLQNEKVDLAFIELTDDAVAALVPAPDAEVTTWLQANQDAVTRYYEANKGEFEKPERVSIRGIHVRAQNRGVIERETDPAKKASGEAERAEARARAEQILADLKAGGETAEGPTPPAAIAADAPADEAGEAPAVAEAPAAGKAAVPVDAFAAAARDKSDHASTKDAGGLFDAPRNREEMGRWPFGPEAAEAVFALGAGQVSDVIEVDSGFWIVRVDEKLAAENRTLDEARLDIAKKLYKQSKLAEYRTKLAEEVLAEAKKDPTRSLEEVAKAVNARYGVTEGGLAPSVTGPFARMREGALGAAASSGWIPGIGTAPELVEAAFAATEAQPVLGSVFKPTGTERAIVARLEAKIPAGEMTGDSLDAVRDQLLAERQRQFYLGWYDDLRARAEKDGDISFSRAYRERLQAARDAYRDAGGALTPATAAAAASATP